MPNVVARQRITVSWEDQKVLILAGTPIGNVGDASERLKNALADADVIAAEDTRRLRRLAQDLAVNLTAKVVSHFEGNERERVGELLGYLSEGLTVLVITDAGMPSVSDPGYRITAAAIEHGHEVRAIPGPSAVLTALALSGLPVDRFCFEGFAPRKHGERLRVFGALATELRTMVFFESPHRTEATLTAMAEVFGSDRPAAVCRELTKTYEEVARGTLADLVEWALNKEHIKGEITIVVGGATAEVVELSDAQLAQLVTEGIDSGLSKRDAIDQVAASTGMGRKRVYAAAHGERSGRH